MINLIFSGKCPQCQFKNNRIEMRQNEADFWECPDCQLQIIYEGENAAILPFRGRNNFKTNLKKFGMDCILEETNPDSHRNGILILDENHLKDYLKNNVESIEEFTLLKLIDTYVNYKYNNHSKNIYDKQSKYFKIDFEDISIEEDLIKRDKENNQNPLYAHSRLFRFLQIVLDKYYRIDNSWLPEMGMSPIEHYLCVKHFPYDELKLINSNPILVRQKLKELATDLIKIIYLNENILLSYDLEEMKKIKNEIKNN